MKVTRLGVLLLLVILALTVMTIPACTPSSPQTSPAPQSPAATKPAQQTVIKLKAGGPQAPKTSANLAIEWWGNEISKRSAGKVQFEYFWGGSVAKAGEELNAVKTGLLDVGMIVTIYYPSLLANGVYAVPFGGSDVAREIAVTKQWYKEFPILTKQIKDYNQDILAWYSVGTYNLLSNKQVKTLDDFKGLKVAIIGEELSRWLAVTGAVGISAPIAERYTALQTGVFDASCVSDDISYSSKFYEVTKYHTTLNLHIHSAWLCTINSDTWNKLPQDVKALMTELAPPSEEFQVSIFVDQANKLKEELTKANKPSVTLPKADMQKWASQIENEPLRWANAQEAKGQPGKALMKRFLEIQKQYGTEYPRDFTKDF